MLICKKYPVNIVIDMKQISNFIIGSFLYAFCMNDPCFLLICPSFLHTCINDWKLFSIVDSLADHIRL